MKLRLLSLAAAALTAFAVHAGGNVLDNPDNHSYFGVRIAWDYTMPSTWHGDYNDFSVSMFKPGSGISAGVAYHQPIVANLFFEPQLSVFYNTYVCDELYISSAPGNILAKNPTAATSGFRLPLQLGYRFDLFDDLSISVLTGPEFAYCFGGKLRLPSELKSMPDYKEMSAVFGKDGFSNRFNVAWTAGAGFYMGHWYVNVVGSFGLNNRCTSEASFKEYRVTVGAGYNF